MCGIAGGFWCPANDRIYDRISKAMDQLKLRGPDDRGSFIRDLAGGRLALAQTRLSIIDLSSGGHQPMHSEDGRYSIVYNGEFYNYKEVRRELTGIGYRFNSESDTEVLLNAWIHSGRKCLTSIEGMFAFVIYDHESQTLTCVRDAFGIKPLYYKPADNGFLFSSDVPSILELCESKPDLNLQRCYDYLVHGDYDSEEDTFFADIKHLQPGHLLEYDLKTRKCGEPVCWWTPSIEQDRSIRFEDAVEQVRERFIHNVKLHLRSDVPLGSALSGGIDSSSVVCAIRHLEPDIPIHAFSFIARNYDVSEERWIDIINQRVGAVGHKVFSGASDLKNDMEDMIRAQGEPFGSTSIYAQYKVFQLAKSAGITVTLDGQGADELFAGYNQYPGYRMQSLIEKGEILDAVRFAWRWSQWPDRNLARTLKYYLSLSTPEKLRPLVKRATGAQSCPAWLNFDVLKQADVKLGYGKSLLKDGPRGRKLMAMLRHHLCRSGLTSLLRHGDRNSMRFSVESRVPFLTIPFVELVMRLPEEFLISRNGETKSVFRAAMRGIVPSEILDRRDKIGFATPEKDWAFSLEPVARNWIMDSDQIPMINKERLVSAFDDVMSKRKPFSWQVWRWMNFLKWYEIYGSSQS